MKAIQLSRSIDAPARLVFSTISDIRNFSEAVPEIIHTEFMTEQKSGTGTRFKETRSMKGRESTVEIEVAEYVENNRVRMVSEAGGSVWDTLFTVEEAGGITRLNMNMDILPQSFIARLFTPLIRGMVVKGVESDMDSVKAFCEKKAIS